MRRLRWFVRQHRLAAGILCALVVLCLVFITARAFLRLSATRTYSDTDPGYNQRYWQHEIQRNGPTRAYQEFLAVNAKAPALRQHFAAHVMGALFGTDFGPEGIAYCDPSFSFGCYHGFFGEVISTGGTALIPKLDAACMSAYGTGGTGCTHGIGHGILEYVGYGKLDEALALCGQTTQVSPLLGCVPGVFMENDFRLAGTGDGSSPVTRALDPAHPYAPCDSVAAKYQDACYVELGQWYWLSNGHAFAKAGAYCAALPTVARTHCFMGVGSIAAPVQGYVPETTLAACQTYSGNDQLACRAGAWWGFVETASVRSEAPALCAYGTAAQTHACEKLGDFTDGLFTGAPGS